MVRKPYRIDDVDPVGWDAESDDYYGVINLPPLSGLGDFRAYNVPPNGTGQDPYIGWNGLVTIFNDFKLQGSYVADGIGVSGPFSTLWTYADLNLDGFNTETSLLPLKANDDRFWTRQDILLARDALRVLNPHIRFPRLKRRWDRQTVLDLITPHWLVFDVLDADSVNVIELAFLGGVYTDTLLLDMEDGHGTREYWWPANVGAPAPLSALGLLERWAEEDTFEDEDEIRDRGTVIDDPSIVVSTVSGSWEFTNGKGETSVYSGLVIAPE